MCVCVCVWLGSGSGPSRSPSVLSLTAQRASAGMSGFHHGRWGVASAPRFQLYVHCVAPCRARDGCRAPVSLSGASMARVRCDVRGVCWSDALTAAWSGIGVGGLPFVARVVLLSCVAGLTFIVRVCLWWFPALVPA